MGPGIAITVLEWYFTIFLLWFLVMEASFCGWHPRALH